MRRLALQQLADIGQLPRHQLEDVVERKDADQAAVGPTIGSRWKRRLACN